MIAEPDRYEPRAGDTVLDFAAHYGTSVLPARPRKPQDKATRVRQISAEFARFWSRKSLQINELTL
jgi:transposase